MTMNFKPWAQGIAVVLVLALVILLIAGMTISLRIAKATSPLKSQPGEEDIDHVMVILDTASHKYDGDFIKALKEEGKQQGIATEIIGVDIANYENKVLELLDMARYTQVDGVILHAIGSREIEEAIRTVSGYKIPVITLNSDLKNSGRVSYVGMNRYKMGQEIGELMAEAMGQEGEIAIIEQRDFADLDGEIMLIGMQEVLKQYPKMSIEIVTYTKEGVLSAEHVTTELFNEHPNISGVFSTNSQNTLGVVQALLDLNKVSDVLLMGVGNQEEILDYIDKGIIHSTVYTDYRDMGIKTIKAYVDLKKDSFVSNYINTEIGIINKSNIRDYRKDMKKANEK